LFKGRGNASEELGLPSSFVDSFSLTIFRVFPQFHSGRSVERGDMIYRECGKRINDSKVLGGLGPLSTLKVSSGGEAFSHTYKLTTSPFYNQCGINPNKKEGALPHKICL
jgi:hypothetical protein